MALFHSPKTSTDGLVFMYDTGNKKSYVGEPTTNFVTNPDFSTGDLTGWSSTSTSNSDVEITEVSSENGYNYFHKKVNKTANGGQDRLNESSFYTIDTSKQLTVSIDIWINPLNDYSITFYGRGTTADDTTFDEKPLQNNGSTTSTVDLGGGWVRYIYTLQTAWYTGSGTSFRIAIYPAYGGRGLMEYKVRQVQVEQKPHATPFVNGTRSTTQGLIDRTGNETITLSNLSYDSNAQMSFDGTDDQFIISDPGVGTSFSIEVVIKVDNYSNGPIFISPNSVGIDHFFRITGSGYLRASFIEIADSSSDGYTSTTAINTGEYYHVVISKTPSNGTIYVNGVAEDSHTPTLPAAAWTGDWRIGARWNNTFNLNGEIPILKVYNQALTSTEITKNFNAIRSRFGL